MNENRIVIFLSEDSSHETLDDCHTNVSPATIITFTKVVSLRCGFHRGVILSSCALGRMRLRRLTLGRMRLRRLTLSRRAESAFRNSHDR